MSILKSITGSILQGILSSIIAPFQPNQIQDLMVWHDASDYSSIIQTGGLVDSWLDKSGNGYHSTQTVSTLKPITGAATLNGRNVLSFENDGLTMNSALHALPNGANTIFVVFKGDTTDSFTRRILSFGNGSAQRLFISYTQSLGLFYFTNTPLGVASQISSSGTVQNWNIINTQRSGANQSITINNGATATNALALDVADVNAARIAVNSNDLGFTAFGKIAEIIIYNRALTSTETGFVKNYLSNKWGIL